LCLIEAVDATCCLLQNMPSAGAGEQLLSKLAAGNLSTSEAQQQHERKLHLQDQSLFGPHAVRVTENDVCRAQLHALAISNSERAPGFSHLLKLYTAGTRAGNTSSGAAVEDESSAAFHSPLLRLLRRVALWWYYRVMFDPLDQLVALSSSYELLFQLMTPHQQLSCMADILLVLACPALQADRWVGTSCLLHSCC
jgi:hypothetical protein